MVHNQVRKEIIQVLNELINISFSEETNLNSIFLVGSNHNINILNVVQESESDLDVIILTNSNSFLVNRKYKGIQFDISFINQNNISEMLLYALNGSKFYGKIFSSINQSVLIKDENGIGNIFINVIRELYHIFMKATLPNHSINHIFLHNINSNNKDLNRQNIEELFFAYQRLSTHLFEYISKLIYPFTITGAYRGKVLSKYFNDFNNDISLDIHEKPIINSDIIQKNITKFCPVLHQKYVGVVYSPILEKHILSGNITSFYFGYDNLISENTIIFLTEEELLRNSDIKLEVVPLTNIIPFFSEKQLKNYTTFLVILSCRYMESDLSKRKSILNYLIEAFAERNLKNILYYSLKAVLIAKSVEEISKEKSGIDLLDFHHWLHNMNFSFILKNDISSLPKEMEEILSKLLHYIEDSFSLKERDIKASYVFFGIFKSLRIKIEDLDF